VSRGLGPVQLRALDIVEAEGPIAVKDLADRLGCTDRRAHKVVTSLDERKLVRVRTEDGEPIDGVARRQRRYVASPAQMSEWSYREAHRKRFLYDLRVAVQKFSDDGTCVACGQALPKTPRPVI
jgi:DNA-binding MarR family transcriptional regulator